MPSPERETASGTARHARIKAVFLSIVDLPASERAAALDRACQSDAALRAEVESLLSHHREESLLEPPHADADEPADPLHPGQKVGNFRVQQRIGQGGMGTVYAAKHEYIERRAAIKVLHPHFSQNEQYQSRFLNEARAVNLIHHSGLVEVFEFGLLENGTAYTVMEFLEGESLTERLRRAKAAGIGLGEEALQIALQIAQAMSAVHEKEIVHRDLETIFTLAISDGKTARGRALGMDLGIASHGLGWW